MFVVFLFIMIGFIAYIAAPGLAAVHVRSRWRRFRHKLIISRYYPLLNEENARNAAPGELYRFFGTLEAIEDGEVIWLLGDGVRIPVSMANQEVYILSGHPLAHNSEPGQILPHRMVWDDLVNLAEGTRFFVFGSLVLQNGRLLFESTESSKILVVMYEGQVEHFMSWAIWSGRQRNEFWNFITPSSMLIGSLGYLILTLALGNSGIQLYWLAVGLTGALLPVLPLFPPGIVFYFLYRRFWKTGRNNRADRDILALPFLYFLPADITNFEGGYRIVRWLRTSEINLPSTVILPNGQNYTRRLGEVEAFGRDSSVIIRRYPTSTLEPGYNPNLKIQGMGFGSYDVHGSMELGKSADPMAEFVFIPGDPSKLVLQAHRNAVRSELFALGFFSLSLFINAPLMMWLLWEVLMIVR